MERRIGAGALAAQTSGLRFQARNGLRGERLEPQYSVKNNRQHYGAVKRAARRGSALARATVYKEFLPLAILAHNLIDERDNSVPHGGTRHSNKRP